MMTSTVSSAISPLTPLPAPYAVQTEDLSVHFGATKALDRVSARIVPGAITGLLGRNGSGKSTLLAAIAAYRRPSKGRVLVAGREPYEDPGVVAGICLLREAGDFADCSVRQVLQLAAGVRPTWSSTVADRLLERFKVPMRKKTTNLSRGQRSALAAVVGIASRSPLTMFDETYLGMDAPTRYAFYEELLADYSEQPRTIIISSHLIEEVERLFEYVLVLDQGRLLLQESADDLRERGARVVGQSVAVESFVAPYTVVSRQSLGRTMAATIYGALATDAQADASAAGLDIESVSIQDLFVHLTADSSHYVPAGEPVDSQHAKELR